MESSILGMFNCIYKVNVSTFFKYLNNMKSCKLLNTSILNCNHKINSIDFVLNEENPIPFQIERFLQVFFLHPSLIPTSATLSVIRSQRL
jgi:hypothetical protein